MQCSLCGNDVARGRGVVYVRTDGKALTFCSSKCKKNGLKLGRVGRKLKWTKRYVEFKKAQEKKTEGK